MPAKDEALERAAGGIRTITQDHTTKVVGLITVITMLSTDLMNPTKCTISITLRMRLPTTTPHIGHITTVDQSIITPTEGEVVGVLIIDLHITDVHTETEEDLGREAIARVGAGVKVNVDPILQDLL